MDSGLRRREGCDCGSRNGQRGSLRKGIAKARGAEVSDAELTEFKTAVVKILTPYASAIQIDTEYGLPALQHKAPHTGALLAYEKSGYDTSAVGRLPDLLSDLSVWCTRTNTPCTPEG